MTTVRFVLLEETNAHVRATHRVRGVPGTLFTFDVGGPQEGNILADLDKMAEAGAIKLLTRQQYEYLSAVQHDAEAEAAAARAAAEAEARATREREAREAAEAEALAELVKGAVRA